LFPGVDLFSMMHKKGICVTINSDAHYSEKLEVGYSYVAEQLYKSGFRYLKEYKDGCWQDVPFDSNGIVW